MCIEEHGGEVVVGGVGGVNNLIHYLLCKAHQHCYTMASIELLIAFLSCPPGENAHVPLCAALSLPAQPREQSGGVGGWVVWSVFIQGQTTKQQSN